MEQKHNQLSRMGFVVAALILIVFTGSTMAGLRIIEARYGYGDCWQDVTNFVRSQVHNNQLFLRVENELLGGDPCPGANKELFVRYRLDGQVSQIVVREYQALALPEGQFRPDDREWRGRRRNLEIIEAHFGFERHQYDVTDRLRQMVRGSRLEVPVNNETMGGDPAPGRDKFLEVVYRIGGEERRVSIPEYQILSIGEGDDEGHDRLQRLEIIRAEYGFGRRFRDVTGILRRMTTRNHLELYVSNNTLEGDPAPKRDKELRVQYRVNGQMHDITVREGDTLVLPMPGDE